MFLHVDQATEESVDVDHARLSQTQRLPSVELGV